LFCFVVLVFQAEKLLTAEQAQLATILRQNQSVLGKLKPAAVVRGNLLPPFSSPLVSSFRFFQNLKNGLCVSVCPEPVLAKHRLKPPPIIWTK
jgi:hypothetical protein